MTEFGAAVLIRFMAKFGWYPGRYVGIFIGADQDEDNAVNRNGNRLGFNRNSIPPWAGFSHNESGDRFGVLHAETSRPTGPFYREDTDGGTFGLDHVSVCACDADNDPARRVDGRELIPNHAETGSVQNQTWPEVWWVDQKRKMRHRFAAQRYGEYYRTQLLSGFYTNQILGTQAAQDAVANVVVVKYLGKMYAMIEDQSMEETPQRIASEYAWHCPIDSVHYKYVAYEIQANTMVGICAARRYHEYDHRSGRPVVNCMLVADGMLNKNANVRLLTGVESDYSTRTWALEAIGPYLGQRISSRTQRLPVAGDARLHRSVISGSRADAIFRGTPRPAPKARNR